MTKIIQLATAMEMTNLSLEKIRQITSDPIVQDIIVPMDFRVQTGGVHKDVLSKIITIAHRDSPFRKVTGCDLPAVAARPTTERYFKPASLGYQQTFCSNDFRQTVLSLLLRANLSENDLTGTQLEALIVAMTQEENAKHLPQIAFFGDVNLSNQELNQIDGYFKIITQDVTAGDSVRITSYNDRQLATGESFQLLDDMLDECKDELADTDSSEKVFYISRSLRNALRKDLNNGTSGSSAFVMQKINGFDIPTYDGVVLREMITWDSLAQATLGYATKYSNLAVLTAKQNFVWGINNDDLVFESFYSRDQQRHIMRNKLTFGVGIDHPELVCAAF